MSSGNACNDAESTAAAEAAAADRVTNSVSHARPIGQIAALASASVPGALFGLDDAWNLRPQIVAVVEGQARGATEPAPPRAYAPGSLRLVRATGEGDQAIVDVVADLTPSRDVTAVTSDRVLRSRVAALGASTVGAGTLLRMLPT